MDNNIQRLHTLSDQYWASHKETRRLRNQLENYIQALNEEGYSVRVLARESGLSHGTVQRVTQ